MLIAYPQKKKLVALSGALAFALVAGTGLAGTASAKEHSGASLQCSQEANAKGLHGKERQAFRRHCVREARHERESMARHEHESMAKPEHRRHVDSAHRRTKHAASVGQPHKTHVTSNGDKPKADKTS